MEKIYSPEEMEKSVLGLNFFGIIVSFVLVIVSLYATDFEYKQIMNSINSKEFAAKNDLILEVMYPLIHDGIFPERVNLYKQAYQSALFLDLQKDIITQQEMDSKLGEIKNIEDYVRIVKAGKIFKDSTTRGFDYYYKIEGLKKINVVLYGLLIISQILAAMIGFKSLASKRCLIKVGTTSE